MKIQNTTTRVISAAILALCCLPAALAQDSFITESTQITACGALFNIDSNAAGLTAKQRAVLVQGKLDKALVEALDRSPSIVTVELVNRNPVVKINNHIIVTADNNSAERNQMTQMELAEKWADSIRACLASGSINHYLSMLTGKYPVVKATISGTMMRDEIAVLTTEALLPIDLVTPISTDTARIGDRIEAVVSHDVPLRTSFDTYLPAGTKVIGQIESASPFIPNNIAGKDAFTVNFYELRTPDNKRIPIDAHIYGTINSWKQITIKPVFAQCCDNGITVKDMNLVRVMVNPVKGNIVGSWKGTPMETMAWDDNKYPRLVFQRNAELMGAPAGEHMLLQFSATTVVAVAGKTF